MSTVYYLKWGRLQLDMLDEFNVKPTYSTSESNNYENEINTNDEPMNEKKASTYEKKVQYIMIPLKRTNQNNIPSKPYLDKDFTHIDIPEHVHNTLKNMSECFTGKVEEDIYATAVEEKMPDDKSGQASRQVKEVQATEEPANEKTSELSNEIEEDKETATEETTEVVKEEKEDEEVAKEEVFEAAKETKEDEEASEVAEETKEDKDAVKEEASKEDDEFKETVEIVAEIKNELGIESAKENDKQDIGGEGKMEDMEKDYDVVEDEYNPVNEKEILEKLNPKVEVVDEYEWHEDSYYEQQKIDQLMGHYEQTKNSNLNNSYYDEAKNTENQGVVRENPVKNRGLKSKIKNLFRRKW